MILNFLNAQHLKTGGAGLIFTEATAVEDIGRITPLDAGIYKDEHIPMLKHIVSFMHSQNAAIGIQLAHSGRKGSTGPPFYPSSKAVFREGEGGWKPVGPSTIPFHPSYPIPHELTIEEIERVKKSFEEATIRAEKAGFDVIELHFAHVIKKL